LSWQTNVRMGFSTIRIRILPFSKNASRSECCACVCHDEEKCLMIKKKWESSRARYRNEWKTILVIKTRWRTESQMGFLSCVSTTESVMKKSPITTERMRKGGNCIEGHWLYRHNPLKKGTPMKGFHSEREPIVVGIHFKSCFSTLEIIKKSSNVKQSFLGKDCLLFLGRRRSGNEPPHIFGRLQLRHMSTLSLRHVYIGAPWTKKKGQP